MKTKRLGMIFAIISAVSWGTYGTFYSLLLDKGATDLTLVALAPLALVFYFGIRVLFKPRVLKEIPLKYYIGMILQGIVIVNGMNFCYSQAYANGMAVGIVSVVAYLNILVIMIESYFLMKYRFTIAKVLSMVLAIIGVAFVLDVFSGGGGLFTASGLIWTALIPIFYGTNVTMNSYFIVKECDSDAILFVTQLAAFLFMVIFQVHPGEMIANIGSVVSLEPMSILTLLGFCGIPMIFCYIFMQECLKRIEPSIFGICYSLDPVTSTILGVLVFSQAVGGLQLLGIALILVAVAYINFAEGKEAKAEAVPAEKQ